MAAGVSPPDERVATVLWRLARRPIRHIVRPWNWKAAITSAVVRGAIFYCANLPAGQHAATAALITEFIFRTLTSGFYGAITQAFRSVKPRWHGMATAMILLPVLTHSLEFAVHYVRGTERLGTSITASICFTAISTAFNLFAMQRGALVIGEGADSLLRDLMRMPSLLAGFVFSMVCGARDVARRCAGLSAPR